MAKNAAGESPPNGAAPRLYSIAEIADEVDILPNTVRSHFSSYSDVLRAESNVGPRGKRAFSEETVEKYKLFLLLRSDAIRLHSSEAMDLLRNGHYDTLSSEAGNISNLVLTVQRLRAAQNSR